jgi:hypothetical protein
LIKRAIGYGDRLRPVGLAPLFVNVTDSNGRPVRLPLLAFG